MSSAADPFVTAMPYLARCAAANRSSKTSTRLRPAIWSAFFFSSSDVL
jgi:hypothetical protein